MKDARAGTAAHDPCLVSASDDEAFAVSGYERVLNSWSPYEVWRTRVKDAQFSPAVLMAHPAG